MELSLAYFWDQRITKTEQKSQQERLIIGWDAFGLPC
jgi:hypothetical protein